jgi:hypothetical protein
MLLKHVIVALGMVTLAADLAAESYEISLRREIPKVVAEEAALSVKEGTAVPAPILLLEGVESGDDGGFTIKVLGPPLPGNSSSREVLAVAGMVGQEQTDLHGLSRKTTLAIPLNSKAAPLLASQREVVLTVKIVSRSKRLPFTVERATFRTEGAR